MLDPRDDRAKSIVFTVDVAHLLDGAQRVGYKGFKGGDGAAHLRM